MKIVHSTNGFDIQVSDEDFEFVKRFKWQVNLRDAAPISVSRKPGKVHILLTHEILKRRGINFKDDVDHKDRNVCNNQFENLRPASKSQNMANRKLFSNNKTGYKGVTFSKARKYYIARIQVAKCPIFIGAFHDVIIAAKAYDVAAKRYHGEFASLNFPEELCT